MRPTDLISLFAPAFDMSGVEWMIAGGVASIVYGEPRLTQDIDIVVSFAPGDAMRFDVRGMLRVLGDTIDRGSLEREAASFGLTAAWNEMERLPD